MSAGAVPKTELGYAAVGRRLVHLRRQGRVSYRDITDGTRWVFKPRSYDGWQEVLAESANSYRQALWNRSEYRLQLFTEKDAISGIIAPITHAWDISLGVLRGYASESFAWSVGQSMSDRHVNVLAQLGDHDPSGVGAWQDFSRKVAEFAPGARIVFHRLAVTPEQISDWNLPLRPTKTNDSARRKAGSAVRSRSMPSQRRRYETSSRTGSPGSTTPTNYKHWPQSRTPNRSPYDRSYNEPASAAMTRWIPVMPSGG